MNYFIGNLLDKSTSYYLEVAIAVIVGILLIITIVMLTIIKKLKDK